MPKAKKPKETVHQKGARIFRERYGRLGKEALDYEILDEGLFHAVTVYSNIDGESCDCDAYTLCWHIIYATLVLSKIERR
jgi:hypothetical protein